MSITLPKLPMLDLSRDNLYGYTADQLRARDLEVVRLVLDAAAQSCEQQAGRIRNLRNTWEQEAAASPLDHAALLIRALEVRHHE